jgi:hypothetical protein
VGTRNQSHVKTCIRILSAAAAGVLLTSCATKQLERDFATFSSDYASDMNWQMLLNLARLDHGHPAYFMAVGEIRLDRSQTSSLNMSGNTSHTTGRTVAAAVSNTVTNVLGGTVTPGGSINASPKFVFIPINSEEAARQLLAPISIDAFNMLYQQGWPVDQLLRVLVERIEVELRNDDGTTEHIVLTNSPLRGAPESFARFLRVCEIVRELQKAGGLGLVAEERFTPLTNGELANVTPKDLLDASDKGRVWRRTADGWQLGTTRTAYRFRARSEIVDDVISRFARRSDPDYDASLRNLHAVFEATVTSAPMDAEGRRGGGTRSLLVLRSFRSVLEAVAQEQRAMEVLLRNPEFARSVPPRQLRPVLKTVWGSEGEFAEPAAELTYAKVRYRVTDAEGAAGELDGRWNRDVFRLLVQLSSQVTVDITKFQRQVLEVQ